SAPGFVPSPFLPSETIRFSLDSSRDPLDHHGVPKSPLIPSPAGDLNKNHPVMSWGPRAFPFSDGCSDGRLRRVSGRRARPGLVPGRVARLFRVWRTAGGGVGDGRPGPGSRPAGAPQPPFLGPTTP